MKQRDFFTYSNTHIQLIAPEGDLDFFDSQSVCLSKEISAIEAWRIIVANHPSALKFALRIRDRLSSWFGVKPIGGFSDTWPENIQVNDQLSFFRVEYLAPNVLALTVRDKHLDVMTCITTDQKVLTITSSVIIHNAFGRLYMIPVAPAHRLIVRNDLKRINCEII